MKKAIIKIMSLCLCAVMLTGLSACKSEEKVTAVKKIEKMGEPNAPKCTFDFLGDDVMPIAGYYGPILSNYSVNGQSLPDYISDEFFGKIAESGVNLLHHQYTLYGKTPGAVKDILNLGEKHGLGVCVFDERISHNLGEETLSVEDIDMLTNEYRNYPAFCGLYIVDEPGADYYISESDKRIRDYVPLFKNLKALDIFGYINLYPMRSRQSKEFYEKYMQEYIDTCEAEYLSWDKYPFDENSVFEDYFTNMSICRKYAEKANIPFWPFIQAGAQWNDGQRKFDSKKYWPSEGEFTWNVNTCLAYGAKGIQYFPLIQPNYYAYAETERFDFERNAIFGAWGNKNRWFYYAQNVDRQIAAIDHVLMNAENKGIIVKGKRAEKETMDSDYILDGDSWRELESVEGDTLIGCFNYKGGSAFYVVNYDMEYSQKISLSFADKYNMSVTQEAEKTYVSARTLELSLLPGAGALVVIE